MMFLTPEEQAKRSKDAKINHIHNKVNSIENQLITLSNMVNHLQNVLITHINSKR